MQIFGTINVAMFDWPWSGIHFLMGALIGLSLSWLIVTRPRRRFWSIAVGLLVVWEIYERTMHYLDVHDHVFIAAWKASVMGFAFAPETKLNSFGDLVIGTIGLWVGRKIWLALRRPRA